MIITTTDDIPGYRIVEVYGLVRGNTVRAKHIGKDILAILRNIVGGEIVEYSTMLAEAREEAIDRMVSKAEKMGANAVVGLRFITASIMQAAAELLAYGTAVKVEKIK